MIARLSVSTVVILLFSLSAAAQAISASEAEPGQGAATEEPDLAAKGSDLARKYCYDCHGLKFNGSANFQVLDAESLIRNDYLVPGDADSSLMWVRIADGEMPPEDADLQPSDAERLLLKRWIAAGAPQPVSDAIRPYVRRDDVLAAVVEDLRPLRRSDRRFIRYFDLSHLSNTPSIAAADLQIYRAGTSKLINSLHWEAEVTVPKALGPGGVLLRIDLRDYGWTDELWNKLLSRYPYGLRYQHDRNSETASLDEQLRQLTETELCIIRVDWFLSEAARSPLYDDFLDLPDAGSKLESRLGVDFVRNFREGRLRRAGFTTSGVSRGNRLIERHPSSFGYYWKSYDFKDGGTRSNLFRFPLGPQFSENPFNSAAFEHDGGEVIFSLPNGLQGYMLLDEQDRKISVGPIDVVRDTKEISGSPQIVNAISCIHCHSRGLIRFRDDVLRGHAAAGEMREKVVDLHPADGDMSERVTADIARFERALSGAVAVFVAAGLDGGRAATEEPVGYAAVRYHRDIDLAVAAAELGIEDADRLQSAIASNPVLVRLGLGPLAEGGSVKRSDWEDQGGLTSTFQEAARILGIGTPAVFQLR